MTERCNAAQWSDYVSATEVMIPVSRLTWDPTGEQGQIRPLDYGLVAQYEMSLINQSPVRPIDVFVKDLAGIFFTRDPV